MASARSDYKFAINRCFIESTVHSLVHYTGDRKIYIKLIWLVAAIASCVYCTVVIASYKRKYTNGDMATTIQANALDFEFPDVYFCSEKPISGSYSVTLNKEDSKLLSQYRRTVSESMAKSKLYMELPLENYAIRLVNTLPSQFLFDKMAHAMSAPQVRCEFNGKRCDKVQIFRHPSFLNCFTINFTENNKVALRKPSNILQLVLFLDLELPPPFDNSTEQDLHKMNQGTYEYNLKPIDWDLNNGLDVTASVGWRLYLVSKGQYPSNLDTHLSLGPGQNHQITIEMQDTVYNEAGLPGQCESSSEATADFLNPYTGEKQTFSYSPAVCWYSEIARISMEQFNCSVWRMPIPWKFRSIPSCFNLTEFPDSYDFTTNLDMERFKLLDSAREACESRVPCRTRVYSYRYSSSRWPVEKRGNKGAMEHMFRELLFDEDIANISPGFYYMLHNSSFQHVRDSMLQIQISALSRKSQQLRLSLAYDFDSFSAEVGGIVGLFLGISVMSVLELLELLHDCALTAWKWRSGRVVNSNPSDDPQRLNAVIEQKSHADAAVS